jgi:hypothetical protein
MSRLNSLPRSEVAKRPRPSFEKRAPPYATDSPLPSFETRRFLPFATSMTQRWLSVRDLYSTKESFLPSSEKRKPNHPPPSKVASTLSDSGFIGSMRCSVVRATRSGLFLSTGCVV